MGVDYCFYIQKRTKDKWASIFLTKTDGKIADIWRCGRDIMEYFNDWMLHVSDKDIKDLALDTGWYINGDEIDFPFHCISLAKLKYLTLIEQYSIYDTPEEAEETRIFYKNLVKDIEAYLSLAGEDYIDIDNIRIICFVSY